MSLAGTRYFSIHNNPVKSVIVSCCLDQNVSFLIVTEAAVQTMVSMCNDLDSVVNKSKCAWARRNSEDVFILDFIHIVAYIVNHNPYVINSLTLIHRGE